MAPHSCYHLTTLMRWQFFVTLVLSASKLVRAAAASGDEVATGHEIKFIHLPNTPYAATLASIVDALPRSTSSALSAAAAAAAATTGQRSPTEVASLLKLAQLAPLLKTYALSSETSSSDSHASHSNSHSSSNSRDWQRWSAVQGQAERLLKWRRAPMDPIDKGDDRLRGGTPPSTLTLGNNVSTPSSSWYVSGGSTVKPQNRHAFLQTVPGAAFLPQTATVGVSSSSNGQPLPNGPRRPLAVTMISHPVDRCMDALLSRWEQKLLRKQQVSAQNALYGSRLDRETVNGTALVLATLQKLVNAKTVKTASNGAWNEKRTAAQPDKASLDELVSQVTNSGGPEPDSMWGDLEEKRGEGSSMGGSATTPLRCRNEQWRLLRPKPPGGLSVGKLKKLPFQAGEEWGLTPLLVLAQFDLVLVSDRGNGDGRPWAFSSRPGTHDQAPFGLPPRGPYREMRGTADIVAHQRTETKTDTSERSSSSIGYDSAGGSNSYSGSRSRKSWEQVPVDRSSSSDGGVGHGERFLESLAMFQLALGLSVGDLACHTTRSLSTPATSTSTSTSKSSSNYKSYYSDGAERGLSALACELAWCFEANQQAQASKARVLLERLYPDLRRQVSAMNSLDLELHSIASIALGIRRRAFDEVPPPTPLKKDDEREEHSEKSEESWTDSFVAVYGEVSSRHNHDQSASCPKKSHSHSTASRHQHPPHPHDQAVGTFTALLTALRALFRFEPSKQSEGSSSGNGEPLHSARAGAHALAAGSYSANRQSHSNAASSSSGARLRNTNLKPKFFSYTAEELKAVENDL